MCVLKLYILTTISFNIMKDQQNDTHGAEKENFTDVYRKRMPHVLKNLVVDVRGIECKKCKKNNFKNNGINKTSYSYKSKVEYMLLTWTLFYFN